MEQLLADIDQASFLALRALRRGPVVQVVWRYPQRIDPAALEPFRRALDTTLLGRRVERSSVPGGRHRWVRADEPGPLVLEPEPVEPHRIGAWTTTIGGLPIDPETGPGWVLAVAPLTDGGTAVSLAVSHTVGDGLAVVGAARTAALGLDGGTVVPPPRTRITARDRWRDARTMLRAVRPAVRGVAASARLARSERDVVPGSPWRSERRRTAGGGLLVDLPVVLAGVAEADWRARAEALGGSVHTLFAGLAVRMGAELGRVDPDGCVSLTFPISDRIEGDTRANALVPLIVRVRPEEIATDLVALRTEIGRRLADLRTHGSPVTAALAATPFVPKSVVRRMEGVAAGSSATVACSFLGVLDPAVGRPAGTDAVDAWFVAPEPVPEARLRRLGGALVLGGGSVNGRLGISVVGWQPGLVTAHGELLDRVRRVFADFGLPADFR